MTWIVLLDRRRGRLLDVGVTKMDSPHVEEFDVLEDTWEEREHLRQAPSLSPDRGSHTDWSGQERERRRRFARKAVDWMAHHVQMRGLEELTVFCAPGLLSELRAAVPVPLAARLDVRKGDYVGLPLPKLARHSALQTLLAKA